MVAGCYEAAGAGSADLGVPRDDPEIMQPKHHTAHPRPQVSSTTKHNNYNTGHLRPQVSGTAKYNTPQYAPKHPSSGNAKQKDLAENWISKIWHTEFATSSESMNRHLRHLQNDHTYAELES